MLSHLLLVALAACAAPDDAASYFKIRVVDSETGRGVPLVELRTTGGIRLFTDSAGVAAFHEPGLMDSRVFFFVSSHGYEFPKDGFGFRGRALEVKPGGGATLKINRVNLAQRLYRVTGAGIYRDSVLLGEEVPLEHPLLNGRVVGSDSVVNAVYRGKIYWFWGDTNRPRYPLGLFHVPGATSELPDRGGLDPAAGVELRYFVGDDGFARAMAEMPGSGPTWIGGLVVVPDADGRERLLAHYVKVKPPLTVYQHGLVQFDDEAEKFEKLVEFPEGSPFYPGGHPYKQREGDKEYVYFGNPFPMLRTPADVESVKDLARYEAFTCLKAGSRMDDPQVDRGADGRLRYAWKRDTPVVGPGQQTKLRQRGLLREGEGLLQLRERDSGQPVAAHGGSVYWNEFRRRYLMIAVQGFGTSMLGEVWYAEADTPQGPWCYAVKVVTHDKYSFYNPKQHPFFDQRGGRSIFFEGTYTAMFSGNEDRTPRYNYNQIMYRLDLDDPRTALPCPVYQLSDEAAAPRFGLRQPGRPIAFFAHDRAAAAAEPGAQKPAQVRTIPVFAGKDAQGRLRYTTSPPEADAQPAFHALPADLESPPEATVPLWEFVHADGRRVCTTQEDVSLPGFKRQERPLCRVWRNPFAAWPLVDGE